MESQQSGCQSHSHTVSPVANVYSVCGVMGLCKGCLDIGANGVPFSLAVGVCLYELVPSVLLQSACAVCVNVGSFSDPEDIPGLAHLLEHSELTANAKLNCFLHAVVTANS